MKLEARKIFAFLKNRFGQVQTIYYPIRDS